MDSAGVRKCGTVVGLILVLGALGPAAGNAAPAQAARESQALGVDDINRLAGETLCIGVCDDRRFSPENHKAIQAKLWSATVQGQMCTTALNNAIYRQDIGEFYKAEAHFDNCAFSESMDYLKKLRKSADARMMAVRTRYRSDGDFVRLQKGVGSALEELGRGIHIIQDFYAHTNYIDLLGGLELTSTTPYYAQLRAKSAKFSDDLSIALWEADDARMVLNLQKQGLLYSGTVFYETPRLNRCPPSSATHEQLAKDSATSGNGAAPTRWEGLSKNVAAMDLARGSTRRFLLDFSRQWPELEGACGKFIRILQPSDARVFN